MMTSLLLLVPIVVSVTAAPFQQILDDRPTGQTKEILPVSPEVRTGVVKVDSKKPPRKQTTKISGNSKEAKTSQVLLPFGNQDDKLYILPRNFPVATEGDAKVVSKKPTRKQAGTVEEGIKETKTNRLPLPTADRQDDRPTSKTKSTSEQEPQEPELEDKPKKKERKHKAFFVNYPFVPRVQHRFPPNLPYYGSNLEDSDFGAKQRTPGGNKNQPDSNIYYIRLPPTPYLFVPGLGYVPQPPRYSPPLMRPQITHLRPGVHQTIYQPHVKPFIKVPVDFVSNGKPTSVYQWTPSDDRPSSRPSNNRISTLDKGPYAFNGKPTSLYLLRPDGEISDRQPIRYSDYQDNGYY